MITAYHRPQTLEEALELLSRPNILPLGGGTLLSNPQADPVEVVDLQSLDLGALCQLGVLVGREHGVLEERTGAAAVFISRGEKHSFGSAYPAHGFTGPGQ